MSRDAHHASNRPFLSRLRSDESDALRMMATRRRYPARATLFLESDPAHEVIIIERGEVSVSVAATDGREVVIDVFGPGALVGELSAIDGANRSASAVALVDVEVVAVPMPRFAYFLTKHPHAQQILLELLAGRLRNAARRHLELGTADAIGRVCARLDELVTRYGREDSDGISVDLPMTQTDIANWSGLSREAVVKALRALRALRWIDNTRNTIVVHDLAAIRARAHS